MSDIMTDSVGFVDPKPVNAPKQEIMLYAEKIASALAYKPGDKFGPLVRQFGGEIRYTDEFEFEDGVAGAIEIRSKENFTIYLPEFSTSPNRDRFTIAHELGHYFLHSKMGEIPMRVFRGTSTTDLIEWQANWFAGAFLMPAREVTRLHGEGFSCSASADYFRVSEAAMKVRWKTLNLGVNGRT